MRARSRASGAGRGDTHGRRWSAGAHPSDRASPHGGGGGSGALTAARGRQRLPRSRWERSAEVHGDGLRLFATATPEDGSVSYRVEVTGGASDPDVVGKAAYFALLEQGASSLLEATN